MKVYPNEEGFRVYKKYTKEYYGKQKRDNDRYATEGSNKTKAAWQLINRLNGKTQEDDNKLEKKI